MRRLSLMNEGQKTDREGWGRGEGSTDHGKAILITDHLKVGLNDGGLKKATLQSNPQINNINKLFLLKSPTGGQVHKYFL